jgi:hypothetical protein
MISFPTRCGDLHVKLKELRRVTTSVCGAARRNVLAASVTRVRAREQRLFGSLRPLVEGSVVVRNVAVTQALDV